MPTQLQPGAAQVVAKRAAAGEWPTATPRHCGQQTQVGHMQAGSANFSPSSSFQLSKPSTPPPANAEAHAPLQCRRCHCPCYSLSCFLHWQLACGREHECHTHERAGFDDVTYIALVTQHHPRVLVRVPGAQNLCCRKCSGGRCVTFVLISVMSQTHSEKKQKTIVH